MSFAEERTATESAVSMGPASVPGNAALRELLGSIPSGTGGSPVVGHPTTSKHGRAARATEFILGFLCVDAGLRITSRYWQPTVPGLSNAVGCQCIGDQNRH